MNNDHVFSPKMGYANRYTVYEIEKDRKYLLIDNHKSVNIQENGLPEHSELISVNSHDQIRELFKSREIYPVEDVMYPATIDQVKALYDPVNEAKARTMTFLCESCIEMEDCPRFTVYQKYLVLYNRDHILGEYSYYRGMAYHATILECPSYKPGNIDKNRGFTLEIKRCEDCPWIEREQHYDYNDSVSCGINYRTIHDSSGVIDSEINFIPDWCPKLNKNINPQKE